MKRAGKRGLLLGLVFPLLLCSVALAGEWFEDNLKAVGNDAVGTAPNNEQEVPDIASDSSDNALMVWQDERQAGEDTNIYFSKGSGSAFSTNVRVDDQSGADTKSERPRMAVSADGQTLYMVWHDDRSAGNWDVYLARSTDAGSTFYSSGNPNRLVDSGTGGQKEPTVEVNASASVIHLAWYDADEGKIVYCRETNIDGTNPFGTTLEVSDVIINVPGGEDATPDMAIDIDGLAYIVWREDGDDSDGDIYFSKNSTSGGAFQTAAKVHPDNTSAQINPRIAVSEDGTDIYVVWDDERSGDWDIYFTSSSDGGSTFSTPTIINEVSSNDQQYADLVLDSSGNIHLVWQDDRNDTNDPDIYYARSTDGGENFIISKRADRTSTDDDATTGDQTRPCLAVSSKGTVHVGWGDSRNTGSGDVLDIYYGRLRPGKPTSGDLDTARYLSTVALLDKEGTNAEILRIPVDKKLFVYVNRPLNEETVNASTVTVKQKTGTSGSYSISVAGTVHYLEGTLLEIEMGTSSLTSRYAVIFEPSGNLSPGADYRMTLFSKKAGTLDGIQDLEGNGFAAGANKLFDFSTKVLASYTISDVYNYPNPTPTGTTNIRYTLGFELDSGDKQWVKIYNSNGRLIRTLESGTEVSAYSGIYEAEWDGTWDDGREVSNGLYLYRVIVLDSDTGRSVERVGKAVIAR